MRWRRGGRHLRQQGWCVRRFRFGIKLSRVMVIKHLVLIEVYTSQTQSLVSLCFESSEVGMASLFYRS